VEALKLKNEVIEEPVYTNKFEVDHSIHLGKTTFSYICLCEVLRTAMRIDSGWWF